MISDISNFYQNYCDQCTSITDIKTYLFYVNIQAQNNIRYLIIKLVQQIYLLMQAASIFNGQYEVQKKISSGSFGVVLLGHDKVKNVNVAIKIEKEENEEVRSLEREVQILTHLNGTDGVPTLYWHGEQDDYNVIVIQLLGKDLSYFMKNKKRFSLKSTLQLGITIVQVLERIHNKGVVHRDLKPENVLFGIDDEQSKIYVVDFGISKIFRDKHGNINPFRDNASFIGTTRYASIAAHKGYELSRKDDIESLTYVLIYFLKGQLPWQNMQNVSDEERTIKVGEMKMNLDPKEICKELPLEFAQILEYLKILEYKSEPDYKYITQQFQRAADSSGIQLDFIYDWDQTQPMKISQGSGQVDSNLQRSTTLNQQLQLPSQQQDMKKSLDKQGSNFMRQMSNNQFLAPPLNNQLQPPNVLKRQDSSQQPSVVSGSVMLSTYNSIRPKYQASHLAYDQVKVSVDSAVQDLDKAMKQTAETGQKQFIANPYTETIGWRDSIFEENFDEVPLSKKYGMLKQKGVDLHRKTHSSPDAKKKKK